MNKTKSYRYFLMDLDGTISNPKEGITKAAAYALEAYGIEVKDLDTLCKFIGPPLMESFQNFDGFSEEQSKAAVEKFREYYKVKGLYENEIYDGMKELLASVKKQGGTLILATSKATVFAIEILKLFEIEQYFSFVAGSTLDLSRSSKADVIDYAIQSVGIDKSQAIMIGDRKHDIIGAKTHGMDSIGVLYGFGDRKELEDAGATYLVDTVKELENLLCSFCK